MAQTLRDLERLGYYGDVVLRSDGEPALVDLMKEIAKGRGNRRTVIEHSAPGDSQGNGFIERGVRSVQKMTRVLKLDLEHRLTTRLEVTHPVFAWLVEHAVDLHNKFLVGSDGKTAYERLKGKKYRGEVLPFASPSDAAGVGEGSGRASWLVRGCVAGQTFPHRRTFGSSCHRWRCGANPQRAIAPECDFHGLLLEHLGRPLAS